MEQYLIDKLWEHTDKGIGVNRKATTNPTSKIEKQISSQPHSLPASLFFSDASSTLFMSFHNESSNGDIHYHDFFEIIYVCKGSPLGVINGQELHLREGQLCIMNPNAIHYFKKYSVQTDLILNIVLPKELFHKSIFRALFHDPVLSSFFIRYQLEHNNQPSYLYLQQLDKDIDQLIEILSKEYLNNMKYSHVIIESLLTLIFSFILRSVTESSDSRDLTMTKIIDFIYLNYQTITLRSVAEHFNYHPKYLSFLIHKHTGQTFRELIVNIKLQHAINYLLYTNYNIEQIVDILGYKDKSSFYSSFRKEYGTSPSEYRKLYT
jgi:AraC-like DNA-binding protein/mannose-6-phosphate isomerase-like protein (cupin superfamily)